MKTIYIYCEGNTEELFINNILHDYFLSFDIYVYPIICTTSNKNGIRHTGGVSKYSRFEQELKMLSRMFPDAYITMMFDYYGLPNDFPGRNYEESDIYKKVDYIEKAIEEKLEIKKFIAYLSIHEFESLLFSNPESFLLVKPTIAKEILKIKEKYGNPELINDSILTAPSKRIIKYFPGYSKKKDGIIIAKDTGIEKMMQECRHFKEWIMELKRKKL